MGARAVKTRTMIPSQRHLVILETVRQQGFVTIAELVQRLQVSAMTIRRDLDDLSRQRLVERTHGGAVALDALSREDPTFVQRQVIQRPAKEAIAAAAAALVAERDYVILDSGSTVAAMATALESHPTATVISYSLPIVQALAPTYGTRLICAGGSFDPMINAFVGPLTQEMLSNVRVDKAFLGASSISINDGISNSNLSNLALQRIALRVAREIYVLADSSKFSRAPFWILTTLERVTGIITDASVPQGVQEELQRQGVRVIYVP